MNTDGWPAMNASDKLGHYSGQLAEVAVYTEALDPSVITAQYQAATRSAGLLNKITTPNGKTQSAVTYGTTDDLVVQATDGDGGTWKLTPATVTGSSQVYRSAVMGSACGRILAPGRHPGRGPGRQRAAHRLRHVQQRHPGRGRTVRYR